MARTRHRGLGAVASVHSTRAAAAAIEFRDAIDRAETHETRGHCRRALDEMIRASNARAVALANLGDADIPAAEKRRIRRGFDALGDIEKRVVDRCVRTRIFPRRRGVR